MLPFCFRCFVLFSDEAKRTSDVTSILQNVHMLPLSDGSFKTTDYLFPNFSHLTRVVVQCFSIRLFTPMRL